MNTSDHATSICASRSNMVHGVRPPLTAKVNRPFVAIERREHIATYVAAASATDSASGKSRNSWCTLRTLLDVSTELGAHRREHLGRELSLIARLESLPQRGADDRRRHGLVNGGLDGPTTFPGV